MNKERIKKKKYKIQIKHYLDVLDVKELEKVKKYIQEEFVYV